MRQQPPALKVKKELSAMYLQNKYTKCYFSIIDQAKSRELPKEIYTEHHHIIPRSLGGGNDPLNLVELTAREHFICHLLLPKMLTGVGQNKMVHALWCMSMLTERQQQYKIKSHTYSSIKERMSATKKNQIPHNKGIKGLYTQSKESNQKRSDTLKGRPSPNKGNYGNLNPFFEKTHSEESLNKMREKLKGRIPWNKGKKGCQVAWNKGLKLT